MSFLRDREGFNAVGHIIFLTDLVCAIVPGGPDSNLYIRLYLHCGCLHRFVRSEPGLSRSYLTNMTIATCPLS